MVERNNKFLKKGKSLLKSIVLKNSLLRGLFILLYRCGGRKPWSTGYSVYKFEQIRHIIQNKIDIFSQEKLPPNYGFGLDERIVEYPWFFSRLKENEKIILDAGSTLNHADILSVDLLKGRKLHISTLAYEGLPKSEICPTYTFEDLRQMCYKDEIFDAVCCLSTLEHIGMDNTFIYTPDESKRENDKYAYLTAVHEFKRVLKNSGILYLTMPYGRYKNHKWFQIFDALMIEKVKEVFAPSKIVETYFKYENEQWNYSNALACQNGYYFDIHREKRFRSDYLAASESVVCLELIK